jgi:hypothetical protein
VSKKDKHSSHKIKNIQKTLHASTVIDNYDVFLDVEEEAEKYYISSEERYPSKRKLRD